MKPTLAECKSIVEKIKREGDSCDVVSLLDGLSNALCVNMDTTNALRIVRLESKSDLMYHSSIPVLIGERAL